MNQLVQFEAQPSVILEDDDIAKVDYDSEAEAVGFTNTSRVELFDTKELKVQRLEETSNEYGIVRRSLVGGRRDLGKKVKIVGIHKKKYDWSVMDEARLAVFRVFAAAVASRNGGDANIKYGWYGGSRDEIKEIMMYGFRRFEHRGLQYGRGVHLSTANNPMESVKTSVPDLDGLRHVLLCRVILGRPELVNFGSQRDQPSSMKFDSGVNDISSPTKYVIWEHHMNTHILPVYIISFRIDSLTGTPSIRLPTSPHMGINGLMGRLTNYLSSSKMVVIKKLQHEYHKNKISRPGFIRNLRAIAGDDVLRAIVKGL
ncbi:putative poly(ADP-ribose) polymerase, catalytic domain, RST domain-containing protein [Helianthus annuus]|nr:putative poly(ADP-ribose) polymerase, catalytic domain, RST domain-containing protein [Helianthus annuus]